MSATARAAPRSSCSPNQAFFPVIGPAMPIRIVRPSGPAERGGKHDNGYGG